MSGPRISSMRPTLVSPAPLVGGGAALTTGWLPSWLISAVLHLIALNVLAWLGFQYGSTGSSALLVVAATPDAAGKTAADLQLAASTTLEMPASATTLSRALSTTSFTSTDSREDEGNSSLGNLAPSEVVLAELAADDREPGAASRATDRTAGASAALASLPLNRLVPSAVPAGERAEFFGVNASGVSFVFIVDCSRSMIGPRFEAAKRELLYAVRRLSPTQRFYVIFFDGMTKPMRLEGEFPYTPAPVLATQANLARLEAWVQTVINGPWTNPSGAVELALDLHPDAIYLLSDGDFTDHGATRKTLSRRNLDAQRRPKVALHAIGLHSRDGEATLRSLAQTHGGEYRFVPPDSPK